MFKSKQNVTDSKYWKYSKKKKNNQFSIIQFITNFFESILKIKIIKKKIFNNSFETTSFLKSKNILKIRNKKLSIVIFDFLKKLKIKSNKKKIIKFIELFDKFFFNQNYLSNNSGGINYNSSLFIYVFYKHLNLDLILESGVWKGYTTLLFDQYLKKVDKISFDINFDKIEYKSKKTKYAEYDIAKYNFKNIKNFSNTLAFYDDHVSHYDRLKFSNKIGIKYLIFDDDINFLTIHSDGWPSIPTISMVADSLKFKKFKWKSINKEAVANFNRIKVKNILQEYIYVQTPNISSITGYYMQPPMAFLIKK